jgi:hypothetical protein
MQHYQWCGSIWCLLVQQSVSQPVDVSAIQHAQPAESEYHATNNREGLLNLILGWMPGCKYCSKRAIFGDYTIKKCTGPTNRQLGKACMCDPDLLAEELHYCYMCCGLKFVGRACFDHHKKLGSHARYQRPEARIARSPTSCACTSNGRTKCCGWLPSSLPAAGLSAETGINPNLSHQTVHPPPTKRRQRPRMVEATAKCQHPALRSVARWLRAGLARSASEDTAPASRLASIPAPHRTARSLPARAHTPTRPTPRALPPGLRAKARPLLCPPLAGTVLAGPDDLTGRQPAPCVGSAQSVRSVRSVQSGLTRAAMRQGRLMAADYLGMAWGTPALKVRRV